MIDERGGEGLVNKQIHYFSLRGSSKRWVCSLIEPFWLCLGRQHEFQSAGESGQITSATPASVIGSEWGVFSLSALPSKLSHVN